MASCSFSVPLRLSCSHCRPICPSITISKEAVNGFFFFQHLHIVRSMKLPLLLLLLLRKDTIAGPKKEDAGCEGGVGKLTRRDTGDSPRAEKSAANSASAFASS